MPAGARKHRHAQDGVVIDKTLSKGLRLIEILARGDGSGISALAEKTGYTKSNVHRLLQTLCQLGWVRQIDRTDYRLSLKLWEIAQDWLLRFDLPRVAAPSLAKLAAATEETVHLAVLERGDVVFIATIETSKPVRIYVPKGSRAPAYCTATGKAILAFLSDSDLGVVQESLDGGAARRLSIELERTRKRGYAINNAEWQDGVNGVAAPVFMGASNTVIASVGVFGPAIRVNPTVIRRIGPDIRSAANAISRAIGDTRSSDQSAQR
jgi:IclR family transcriptional regulator, KDG regulon repressor